MPKTRPMSLRTILIVEDNPIVRKLFRVALSKEGFQVKEAGTAAEAIAIVKQAAPSLIIQDIMLDDTDGIQLARDYRSLPGCDQVPIIAISGLQPALVLAKAVQSGFVDYLAKPVELTKLIEVVRTHLPEAKLPDNLNELKLIRTKLERSYSAILDHPRDRAFARIAGANAFVTKDRADGLIGERARVLDRPTLAPIGDSEVQTVESGQRTLRQVELQSALNVRLVRRLSVQEIELTLLSELLRLVATDQLNTFPNSLLEKCVGAGRVKAAAIFLLRPSGKIELHSAFGFPKQKGALEKFYGHLEQVENVARYDRTYDTAAHKPPPAEAETASASLGPRMIVSALKSERRKLGALAAVACATDDDYFERFVHLISRHISRAVEIIVAQKRAPARRRVRRT